jgi:hypothetical protein
MRRLFVLALLATACSAAAEHADDHAMPAADSAAAAGMA